jgi:hypothetical protein
MHYDVDLGSSFGWFVARAVKDELTHVRTAEGLSAVFSGFGQLMSTSPDVAQIAAFEL